MPVSKYTGLAYLNIGRKISGFLWSDIDNAKKCFGNAELQTYFIGWCCVQPNSAIDFYELFINVGRASSLFTGY